MTSLLPPREIQARVRAGETLEDLATAAQTTVDKIMVYAGPVLAERAHVAGLAQAASVRRSSDQGGARVLEEAVDARLRASAVDPASVEWDAWRGLDHRWTVVADVPVDGTVRRATFHYDLSGRSVVAEDDLARWLTGELSQRPGVRPAPTTAASGSKAQASDDAPGPGLDGEIPLPPAPAERTLRSVHAGALGEEPGEVSGEAEQPAVSAVDAPTELPGDADVRDDTDDTGDTGEAGGQLTLGDDAIALVTGTPATRPASGPAQTWRAETRAPTWLDAARPADPAPRHAAPSTPDPVTSPDVEPAPDPEPAQEVLFGDPDDGEVDVRGRGGRKRGRATIPSWDEIMFGGPTDGAPLVDGDVSPPSDPPD